MPNAATFGWLCVETLITAAVVLTGALGSHLRVAVC